LEALERYLEFLDPRSQIIYLLKVLQDLFFTYPALSNQCVHFLQRRHAEPGAAGSTFCL